MLLCCRRWVANCPHHEHHALRISSLVFSYKPNKVHWSRQKVAGDSKTGGEFGRALIGSHFRQRLSQRSGCSLAKFCAIGMMMRGLGLVCNAMNMAPRKKAPEQRTSCIVPSRSRNFCNTLAVIPLQAVVRPKGVYDGRPEQNG